MEHFYRRTVRACFAGYVVQAVLNNFVPLLLLTFQGQYGISLSSLTLLVTVNFTLQLLVDLLSTALVDALGCRRCALLAHALAAAGLVSLTVLPEWTADPFHGLLIAVVLYAAGGGLLEVLVSPIVEACPSDNPEQAMSLLHSSYCWGQVAVVLVSTVFFALFGVENWKTLARLWAILPAVNFIRFTYVPIPPLLPEGEAGQTVGSLLRRRLFWVLMLMMLCAGACEQAMAQWASAFAEKGLGLGKALGDLLGPMLFAAAMGTVRTLYGKLGRRWDLSRFMLLGSALCVAGYLLAALSQQPTLGLLGCALCGLSVGVLWPGTYSIASGRIPHGGAVLFALLALAGDLGCAAGPALVGLASGAGEAGLRSGFLTAAVFPVVLTAAILLYRRTKRRGAQRAEGDTFS